MNGSIKKSNHGIAKSASLVIAGIFAMLFYVGIAWGIYELLPAWRPYWANIGTFFIACVPGWLVGDHRRAGKELTFRQWITQLRSPLIVGLIFILFVWRIHELIVAWRPYWETTTSFCIGFAAGLLIALHARWEKGRRMNPRLLGILRPIGYTVDYTLTFIFGAFGYVMLLVGLVLLFEKVVVPHWKPIAWCLGGLTFWIIFGWFATRKDRIRASKSSEPDLPAQSPVLLLQQIRLTDDVRRVSSDEASE